MATVQVLALYCYRSHDDHRDECQLAELEAYGQAWDGHVELYCDEQRKGELGRPTYGELLLQLRAGVLGCVAVWRLDKLGLALGGLAEVFAELAERRVRFVSLRDALYLQPQELRPVSAVLNAAALAQRVSRGRAVAAGQAVAKAKGQRWWPSRSGTLQYLKPETVQLVLTLFDKGRPVAAIAEATGVTRPTVYRLLRAHGRKKRKR